MLKCSEPKPHAFAGFTFFSIDAREEEAVAQGLLLQDRMSDCDVCGGGALPLEPFEEALTESTVRTFGKAQILIGEDDLNVAEELKCRLESLDYEIAGISHRAEQAVALAQRLRPDLVLMNMHLPGEIDGIQAAEQIRTQRLPVVYISGYCEGPVLQRAQ